MKGLTRIKFTKKATEKYQQEKDSRGCAWSCFVDVGAFERTDYVAPDPLSPKPRRVKLRPLPKFQDPNPVEEFGKF